MADLLGKCDDRFEGVRAALARNLDSGAEVAALMLADRAESGQAIYDAVAG